MRKEYLIVVLFFIISLGLKAQKNYNLGGGVFTEGKGGYGVMLGIERERIFTEKISLPCKLEISYSSSFDFNYLVAEIHQSFRKYISSGLFFEQGVGLGVLANYFNPDIYFYSDKYMSTLINDGKPKIGLQPSITCGFGYNFTKGKNSLNAFWVKPKVYWNMKIRGLHLPYYAIQFGFSHTIKSKKD